MATRIEHMMTVADLDAMPHDENRYELIEGELFVSRAPGLTHQRIFGNLFGRFLFFLEMTPIGEIIATPGVIFSEYSAVIPDIIYISNERRAEIASGEWVVAAPDLVIEILSPGRENKRRDRVAKRRLCAKYGVKEYWVVDGENRVIKVYRLREGSLDLVERPIERDEIRSSVLPGFSCPVASIFKL